MYQKGGKMWRVPTNKDVIFVTAETREEANAEAQKRLMWDEKIEAIHAITEVKGI